MKLQQIWLTVCAVVGFWIAALGVLLAIPAMLDRSPVGFLLLLPTVLDVWAFILVGAVAQSTSLDSNLRRKLYAFYLVTGLVTIWTTTWTVSREGWERTMFSLWETAFSFLFFAFPLLHLLFSPAVGMRRSEVGAGGEVQ